MIVNLKLIPKVNLLKGLSLILFTALIVFPGLSQTKRQTAYSFNSKFGPDAFVGYLAYVPKDYLTNPTKKYPLMIFLHGAGEKAYMATDLSNINAVKTHGPPKLIEAGMDFPFIVISPQCSFSDWETVTTDNFATSVSKPGEFVDEILEKMKTLYRVDTDKIYLTGLSMGGAATWSYISLHGDKIAAAIPISGWMDDPTNICDISNNKVGVWAFNNDEDPKSFATPNIVHGINSCEPLEQARSTEYVSKLHDAWTITYNNTGPGISPDNIYTWLMTHDKKVPLVTSLEPEKTNNSDELNIYPVPASDHISIQYYTEVSEILKVQVLTGTSEDVFQQTTSVSKGNNVLDIDISSLENGVYLLAISGRQNKQTRRLVVSR
ncbi:MAG: T9SS type A sorting domain-containing protein [Opitutaceae bacterium]|nr:T9SS type A sorting domain-containing protein [Cytophagales bacterium]